MKKHSSSNKNSLRFLDPENWRSLSDSSRDINEYLKFLEGRKKKKKAGKSIGSGTPVLVVQKHLSPLDIYTYLQSRFGKPNGFMNVLRKPKSDNIIDWDYTLVCDGIFITLWGKKRSVEIVIHHRMTDEDWRTLIQNFRKCFASGGRAKSEEKNRLEEWTVFVNRYAELCAEAASLHETLDKFQEFKFVFKTIPKSKSGLKKWNADTEKSIQDFTKLRQACFALKMLTPIMLEAFINLLILTTCKDEIRENSTLYKAKVEEKIHIKVQSLHLTCKNFSKAISPDDTEYKNFKRIMDNRNTFFHGNADVDRDKLETVYFDGDVPIFKEQGNAHEKYFEKLLAMINPKEILDDYISAHEFIAYVVNCIEGRYRKQTWMMLDSSTLGYNKKEDRFGILFSDILATSYLPGVKYDAELWGNSLGK